MKTLIALLALLAIPFAVPAGPAAAQEKRDEFVEKFRNAQKIGAADEMNRLLRSYQQEAIHTIVYTCEQISIQPTERLEEDMDGLRQAWEAVHKTGFVNKCYEYFSLMRPEIKEHRRKLKVQYDLKNRKFLEAEANKDRTKFGALGMEFRGLAEGFEEIGDWYHASESWIFYGRAFDEELRGTSDADLRRVCEAYGKAVAARDRLELKDNNYNATKTRFTHLEKQGFGDPDKATAPKSTGPVEASAAATLATSFELVEDISAWRRPIFYGDEAYAVWVPIGLRAKGSSAKFLAIEDSPLILRVASAKVMADTDGDGEGDVEIPTPGKITPIAMEIGQGENKRPWGFLTALGGQRDNYNGVQFNLSPSDEQMQIYVAPAASLVATIGETQIRILDDNMDGVYGSKFVEWGHVGLAEDYFQRDLDSVVVGNEKTARPWSEYQEVGGRWYKLESEGKGLAINATPVDGIETGTLKLDFEGGKPDWLVVQGGGTYERAFFDVAQGGKTGIQVPAGRYELFAGQLSQGKKSQLLKTLILPSRNTPAWNVDAGGTETIELGAPFGFDFDVEQDDESVTVVGDTVVVTGRANETYQRLWNCAVKPEVSVRRAGTKRGDKPEDMKRSETQEEISDNGYKSAWFPFDLTLPKKRKGDEVEVQLSVKKHKLFGKIESVWRN